MMFILHCLLYIICLYYYISEYITKKRQKGAKHNDRRSAIPYAGDHLWQEVENLQEWYNIYGYLHMTQFWDFRFG